MHGPEVGTTCLEAIYKNERIKNGVVGPVGPVRYLCTPHSRVMVITGRFMDRLSAISVAVISVGFRPAESEGTNRSAVLKRSGWDLVSFCSPTCQTSQNVSKTTRGKRTSTGAGLKGALVTSDCMNNLTVGCRIWCYDCGLYLIDGLVARIQHSFNISPDSAFNVPSMNKYSTVWRGPPSKGWISPPIPRPFPHPLPASRSLPEVQVTVHHTLAPSV